jgi:glutamate synthase (NADPH/NADH) small chain
MKLVEVEGQRARPIVIENSNYIIKADLVIEAISSSIDNNLTKLLDTHSWGGIKVNENMQTSIAKVFAGGDCVSGPSLVVTAMKDGIKAASNIDKYIKGK